MTRTDITTIAVKLFGMYFLLLAIQGFLSAPTLSVFAAPMPGMAMMKFAVLLPPILNGVLAAILLVCSTAIAAWLLPEAPGSSVERASVHQRTTWVMTLRLIAFYFLLSDAPILLSLVVYGVTRMNGPQNLWNFFPYLVRFAFASFTIMKAESLVAWSIAKTARNGGSQSGETS